MSEPQPSGPSATVRKLRAVIVTLLVVIGIGFAITVRVVISGEREIASSTKALRAGDAGGAIEHARAAALWYAPGAPHVRVAYGRLLSISREAERRRLWPVALEGYRSVVTASASTRHVVAPHGEDVEEAKTAIARIESRTGERPPLAAEEPPADVERTMLADLAEDSTPNRTWRAVLLGSFAVLAAGLVWVLRRGIDETGRLSLARSALGLVTAVAGLAGYLLALVFA
ncbi:MAG: hypothetical protein U0271_13290 [Polyangiaceae bacterium]